MTFSSSILKRLCPVSILAVIPIQFFFVHNVLSLNKTIALNQTNEYLHHQCINSEGTYKSGSLYEENVNKNIHALSENSLAYGNAGVALGDSPNSVYSSLQCRGDLSVSQCRSCLTTASSEVLKRCPKNKGRIIWYDYCVFEIRSVFRFSQVDYSHNFYLHNAKDVTSNKEMFNKNIRTLLYKLKDKASARDQDRKGKDYMYATGEESMRNKKLYAMVQCSKDLSRKNCSACLNFVLENFSKCCNGKQGGRVLSSNCNFRYELYPFVKPLQNESSV